MSSCRQHLRLQVYTISVSSTPSPHPPSFPSSPYSTTPLTENSDRFSKKHTRSPFWTDVTTLMLTVLLYQVQIFCTTFQIRLVHFLYWKQKDSVHILHGSRQRLKTQRFNTNNTQQNHRQSSGRPPSIPRYPRDSTSWRFLQWKRVPSWPSNTGKSSCWKNKKWIAMCSNPMVMSTPVNKNWWCFLWFFNFSKTYHPKISRGHGRLVGRSYSEGRQIQ